MKIRLIRLRTRSEVKKIVHRVSEVLLAAEIAFRRLDRCVSQQELNLFQLASAVMTQLGTGPPQVVGCDMLQARSPTAGPDHVPHHILRNALAPYLARPGDCPKDLSFGNAGGCRPLIERGFDPLWDRHGADVAALADQVHHRPVPLPHLDVVYL